MSALDDLVFLIEERSGIVTPERDRQRLSRLAQSRTTRPGEAGIQQYIQSLRQQPESSEWRLLLTSITNQESYLYRAPEQFRVLQEICIPRLTGACTGQELQVWSAGCAHGEEAVTLAIVLSESGHASWTVHATDVDEEALGQARRGRYGPRAVANVPPHLRKRYFVERAGEFHLDPLVLERIRYDYLNLVQQPLSPPVSVCDVVFLRNVLIYFSASWQRRVVTSVAGVLAPDGYLFVGPSESLWGMYSGLRPVDFGSCFCYRHCANMNEGSAPEDTRESAALDSGAEGPRQARPPSTRSGDDEAACLAQRPRQCAPASQHELAPLAVAAICRDDRPAARSLILQGTDRFPEDPVLRALAGLIHDREGELTLAVQAYRAALYLDPSLFQIRFLLARCQHRMGWLDRAQRELRSILEMIAARQARSLPGTDQLGLLTQQEIEEACHGQLGTNH